MATDGTVLHSWTTYVTMAGLSTSPDGSVIVGNYGSFTIDRVADGVVTTISARLPTRFRPSGVAVVGSGAIYADTDGVNGGANRTSVIALG